MKKTKNKGNIINGIIIAITVIILLCYMFFVDGIDNIIAVFQNAKLLWLVAGALCMVLYWAIEAAIVHCATKCFPQKLPYRQVFQTTMIGQFFNCVTPSAPGGQPRQIYHMNKIGFGAGYATSSLLVRFIVYQLGLTVYSIVVLCFQYKEFASQIKGFKYLIIFGFILNTAVAIGLLLIGFTKNFAKKAMHGICRLLAKLHLLKNLEKKLEIVDREVDSFHDGFRIIRKNITRLCIMFIMTILQLSFFFFVPVTIAFSFGVPSIPIFTMMAAASCVQMASSFIPLPGAAGGAELSFFMLFGMFFPAAKLSSAVLVWRLFTFYFPILCGMFFSRNLFGKRKEILASTSQSIQD